jgi:hypothetical protein
MYLKIIPYDTLDCVQLVWDMFCSLVEVDNVLGVHTACIIRTKGKLDQV